MHHDDAIGEDPVEHDDSSREATAGGTKRRRPTRRRERPASPAAVVTSAVLVAASWWVVGLRPFSGAATATVLAAGVSAMAWGARSPRRRRGGRPVDRSACTGWFAVAGAAAVWEVAAFLQQPREDHPTVSSVANALLDSRPARATAFVAWLVAAAALARR